MERQTLAITEEDEVIINELILLGTCAVLAPHRCSWVRALREHFNPLDKLGVSNLIIAHTIPRRTNQETSCPMDTSQSTELAAYGDEKALYLLVNGLKTAQNEAKIQELYDSMPPWPDE